LLIGIDLYGYCAPAEYFDVFKPNLIVHFVLKYPIAISERYSTARLDGISIFALKTVG
jgi:hypothetical protein